MAAVLSFLKALPLLVSELKELRLAIKDIKIASAERGGEEVKEKRNEISRKLETENNIDKRRALIRELNGLQG